MQLKLRMSLRLVTARLRKSAEAMPVGRAPEKK
jgi:hypothetical protein